MENERFKVGDRVNLKGYERYGAITEVRYHPFFSSVTIRLDKPIKIGEHKPVHDVFMQPYQIELAADGNEGT